MRIKQVIIEGFKTYKDQTISDPFSSKINCVVGANGSGKSNFFHAIRFVLNDIFTTLRAEDRQKLLHEGAGHAVTTAFVEIVFDNSDQRFPVDRDEVRLRRVIGLKKDEYMLDKKHITKSEVSNMLESAGFSKSNPYYVVQQGKINAMTLMRDDQRLDLLKEIGGTKVYEERRKESLKLMAETKGRRERITEVIEQLEEKLAELDAEREELAKYQQFDKQKRSLEYTIYDKEVSETKAKLEQLEDQRRNESERAGTAHEEKQAARSKLKALERELKALDAQQVEAAKARAAAAAEKQEAVAKRARLELDVRDLEEGLSSSSKTQKQCQTELAALEREIEERLAEVAAVKADLAGHESEETDLERRLGEGKRRLQVLYQKQGRNTQFGSEAERDEWIRQEMEQLEKTQHKRQEQLKSLGQEIAQLNSDLMDLSQGIGDGEARIREREAEVARADADLTEMVARRDELQNQRKELWRADAEAGNTRNALKNELEHCKRQMNGAVPFDVNKGLEAVKRICSEHNIQGMHGPVIQLFDCNPQLNMAIDATAGNQLFQVVVDNDEIADRIIKYMIHEKAGRANFMPLNRLRTEDVHYPTEFGTDVVPLLKKLKFNPAFTPAMKQLFAKTLICKDLDVATATSRATQMTCVTLNGDVVHKKGNLQGGFIDPGRSKMIAMKAISDVTSRIEALDREVVDNKERALRVDQPISAVLGEIQKTEATRTHLRNGMQSLREELAALQEQQGRARGKLEAAERRLADGENTLGGLAAQIENLKAEIGTSLEAQLSAQDRAELQKLNPEIQRMEEEILKVRAARMAVQAQVETLDTQLTCNLLKRQKELQERLDSAKEAGNEATLSARVAELEAVGREAEESTAREAELEGRLEQLTLQLGKLKDEQESLREHLLSDEQLLQDEAKAMEALVAKRATLVAKKADLEKKIREVGTLPADAYERFRSYPLKELHKLLAKAITHLKKYGHVNKKALDQYNNFTEERENLKRRQQEMVRAEEKIKQLIDNLDMRKDEAIERTFRQVGKNFKEIFRKLAPGGRGELVMRKKLGPEAGAAAEGEEGEDGSDDEDRAEGGSSEKYSGVPVKVSFGSGETMSMKQLSGGQKTLVALALIFAIQRCDPAPFYLFDEIDAALDPLYRTTVAEMLGRQANDEQNPSQFIITTFHPQIIQQADKIYGVSHSNRISRIDVVSQADALEFVQTEELRQQAAGWSGEQR